MLCVRTAETVGKEITASAADAVIDEVRGVTGGAYGGAAGLAVRGEITAGDALIVDEIIVLIDTGEAVVVGIASQAVSVV